MKRSTARWIKQGDLASDFIGGGLSNALLSNAISRYGGSSRFGDYADELHSGVIMAGNAHGFFSKAPTVADIKAMDKNPSLGFVPGVTNSRVLLRRRAIRHLLNENKADKPYSEIIASRGNVLLSGLAGAGLGAGTCAYLGSRSGTNNALNGAIVGSLVGGVGGLALGGISHGIGSLLAGVTPRRTLEEQYDYENRNNWPRHLLIPGAASYDYYKSLGASKHLSEMEESDINKEVARIRKARGIK